MLTDNHDNQYLIDEGWFEYNKLDYYDKINWKELSTNLNAIDLLKENQKKIDWEYLSKNPAIFKAV